VVGELLLTQHLTSRKAQTAPWGGEDVVNAEHHRHRCAAECGAVTATCGTGYLLPCVPARSWEPLLYMGCYHRMTCCFVGEWSGTLEQSLCKGVQRWGQVGGASRHLKQFKSV